MKAALQFDPGFSTDLKRGRTAVVQVLVDGTDSNTAGVVSDYANRIVAAYNREAARERLGMRHIATAGGAVLSPDSVGIELRARTWYNPDLRARTTNSRNAWGHADLVWWGSHAPLGPRRPAIVGHVPNSRCCPLAFWLLLRPVKTESGLRSNQWRRPP